MLKQKHRGLSEALNNRVLKSVLFILVPSFFFLSKVKTLNIINLFFIVM